jgi:hypothetical protein
MREKEKVKILTSKTKLLSSITPTIKVKLTQTFSLKTQMISLMKKSLRRVLTKVESLRRLQSSNLSRKYLFKKKSLRSLHSSRQEPNLVSKIDLLNLIVKLTGRQTKAALLDLVRERPLYLD